LRFCPLYALRAEKFPVVFSVMGLPVDLTDIPQPSAYRLRIQEHTGQSSTAVN